MEVVQSAAVVGDVADIWATLSDIGAVVRCLPGARLGEQQPDGRYEAGISVRFGVIPLEFTGLARIDADTTTRTLAVRAQGRDRARTTRASADIIVRLGRDAGAAHSTVTVRGTFEFAGPLAGLAEAGGQSIAAGMIREFTENLGRMMATEPVASPAAVREGTA